MHRGRILCLDVGDRKIGVAVSDEMQITAFPVAVVERNGTEIEAIAKIVHEKEAKIVVVGLPRNLKGEVGIQAEKVIGFLQMLKEKMPGIEFQLWDERLTSVIAKRMFSQIDLKYKSVKSKKDAAEAALILQSYLDGKEKSENREES